MQQIERAAEAAACAELVDAPAQNQNAIAHLIEQRLSQVGNVFVEFAACIDDKFGCGRRSGRTDIGNEIGDREIGFVADAGNYWNCGLRNRTRDGFFPKPALDPDTIVGLDTIVNDAVELKYTPAPLTKEQLAQLVQIPPR